MKEIWPGLRTHQQHPVLSGIIIGWPLVCLVMMLPIELLLTKTAISPVLHTLTVRSVWSNTLYKQVHFWYSNIPSLWAGLFIMALSCRVFLYAIRNQLSESHLPLYEADSLYIGGTILAFQSIFWLM